MDLYLIPGLGADHRIFGRLQLPGYAQHFLDWPTMPEGSTLIDFAKVLSEKVDPAQPHALIGVSMGGMVAQELAPITGAQRTIIVSSWKGPQEMPPQIRLLRGTHPERILTKAFVQRTLPFIRWQMGVEGKEESELFDALLQLHTVAQLKVQIAAVLAWEGPKKKPKGLVHIHGDHDRLMLKPFIKDAIFVPKGGHFMVYDKAKEVSALLVKALTA